MIITGQAIIVKNGKSGSGSFGFILYNATTRLAPFHKTISSGATDSSTKAVGDGKYIWVRANNYTNVKYNDAVLPFTKSGNYFMVTLPEAFDPTIPIVFS